MPFNSRVLVSVAAASAEVWQRIACLPDHIPGDQLLDLVICFPARQLGRLAACVWDFLCFSPAQYYDHPFQSSSSDDDDEYGDPYNGIEYYSDAGAGSSSSD
ncbi:unnamed protein product [Cuscuta campestris]|uniref:Uncharacterized protein n=2 Tax=Cuscuta sect. Cleistogrammica TaxID=1824901 RepID=A0A484M2E3_9ASTE|nr:hypothetical protein DM860_009826 [Cuscuta australis]VFQ60021.1 unnamed protein product [Cuscuta campestris]VFQ82168.1 unnamed protein product [Cuscuta campestris]